MVAECWMAINHAKCQLGTWMCEFFGHRVGRGKVRQGPSKVRGIREFSKPVKKDICAFIGLTNYYWRFIQRFSEMAAPLYKMMKKEAPEQVVWTPDRETAFRDLKAALSSEAVLISPDDDKTFPDKRFQAQA